MTRTQRMCIAHCMLWPASFRQNGCVDWASFWHRGYSGLSLHCSSNSNQGVYIAPLLVCQGCIAKQVCLSSWCPDTVPSKNVFIFVRNKSVDCSRFWSVDSLFHTRGVATETALPPIWWHDHDVMWSPHVFQWNCGISKINVLHSRILFGTLKLPIFLLFHRGMSTVAVVVILIRPWQVYHTVCSLLFIYNTLAMM